MPEENQPVIDAETAAAIAQVTGGKPEEYMINPIVPPGTPPEETQGPAKNELIKPEEPESEELEVEKAKKEKKVKAALEPKPEPEPETPKVSKREEFIEKAKKERETTLANQRLKEEAARGQAALDELNSIKNDPLSWIEKSNPMLLDKWFENTIKKYTQTDETPKTPAENREITELKSKLDKVMDLLQENQKTVKQTSEQAYYQNYAAQANQILSKSEYDVVREYSAEYERLTGERVDPILAVAKVYDDFKEMYSKELTPQEACEILKEETEEKLTRFRAGKKESEKPVEDKPKKKKAAEPAKTLTNAQESQSARKEDEDEPKTEEELLRAAAKILEYGE